MAKQTREERQELMRNFDDFAYWLRTSILAGAVTAEDFGRMIDVLLPVTKARSSLTLRIDELGLSTRTLTCLKNRGDIENVGQLLEMTEGELLKTKGFGRKCLNEVKEILADMELTFGMMEAKTEVPDFMRERLLSEARKLSEP
ncbi:MAG: DNA-directed RNA polymerase subunit alpha C-terminal domain-containing protein [Patescibacteria group bacterium]|jgi:hypothetical protein